MQIPKVINDVSVEYVFEIWDTFCKQKSSKYMEISDDGLTYIHAAGESLGG